MSHTDIFDLSVGTVQGGESLQKYTNQIPYSLNLKIMTALHF